MENVETVRTFLVRSVMWKRQQYLSGMRKDDEIERINLFKQKILKKAGSVLNLSKSNSRDQK
jgi:hypothetical protein